MDDLGQLLRLFEIGRMGRCELESLAADLDAEDRGRARSLGDLEAWATAAAKVGEIDRLLADASRPCARSGGGRGRAVAIDMDGYERGAAYLSKLDEERAARDELREAVRRRLRHFEKRDGYRYRPAIKTPLERYCGLLGR